MLNEWSTEQHVSFIEMKIKECRGTVERVKCLSRWYPNISPQAKKELKEWKRELSLVKNNTDEANRMGTITHWIGHNNGFGQPPLCGITEHPNRFSVYHTMNEEHLTCKKCMRMLRKLRKEEKKKIGETNK